ncbi:hybrid sensor histidine kinase/response regulator [Nitrospirillum sp. BR 11828]|uniref:hybrid sensor histidine kinase/response regulator n=1 Tax=Nitrospirillum sp. BR 11828 TaxID=3104325 RepID=UPI002ACAB502|nr:ATP-binding protein [Nitrospirillum sp. BR 11828]MDZ5646570.1 ATP-binding protein [Nitrospirillum sp. BR 11828]
MRRLEPGLRRWTGPLIGDPATAPLEALGDRAQTIARPQLVELGQLVLMALNHREDIWLLPLLTAIVAGGIAAWAPWPAVLLWSLLSIGTAAASQLAFQRFLAQANTLTDARPWLWVLAVTRFAASAAWGLIPLFAWPGHDLGGRYFLMLVMGTAMALRTCGTISHPLVLRVQLVPSASALLVLASGALAEENGAAIGGAPGLALVLGSLLYAVFVYRLGLQICRRMRHMLEMQLDLAAAKRAADQANDAKSGFLATLSHEIRTPMTGILGLTQLLLETGLSMRQRDYVRTVHESGESLLAILNDVLDLSKVEAGKLEIEHRPFDTAALLDGVLNLMAGRAAEKGLDLQLRTCPVFPGRLMGDPLRLRQVLLNLVGNAIKFTDRGWVRISASADRLDDGRMQFGIIVSDTGMGVPEASQGRLFETFSQASVEVTRRYGGSGLGLAIAKRLVQAMGGQIGFRSRPGNGSHFWFTIPTAEPEDEVAVARNANAPPLSLPPLAVLVVEDVTANQVVLDALLRARGHAVTVAADGAAAVRLVAQGRFDLVLMDMQLPGIDGLEATRRIRALPDSTRARVPVVATTANTDAADGDQCLAAGMDGFVTKPIRPDALVEAMHRAWTARGTHVWPSVPPEEAEAVLDARQIETVAEAIGGQDMPEFITITARTLVETADRFAEKVVSGDLPGAGQAVHTLYGVAANVGLSSLAAEARRAQQALRDDLPEIQRALAGTLRSDAEQAAAALTDWLGEWLDSQRPADSAVA